MQFDCSTCDAVFKTKRARDKHSVRHTDARLICEQCDFSCPKYDYPTLRYHRLRMHDGARPHACQLGCGYAGRDLSALRAHQRNVHSVERPFECIHPGCDFSGKTRWAVMKHAARHKAAVPRGATTSQ